MATSAVAAEVYEAHIREAQLAEELGYHAYYFGPMTKEQSLRSLKLFGEAVLPVFA